MRWSRQEEAEEAFHAGDSSAWLARPCGTNGGSSSVVYTFSLISESDGRAPAEQAKCAIQGKISHIRPKGRNFRKFVSLSVILSAFIHSFRLSLLSSSSSSLSKCTFLKDVGEESFSVLRGMLCHHQSGLTATAAAAFPFVRALAKSALAKNIERTLRVVVFSYISHESGVLLC